MLRKYFAKVLQPYRVFFPSWKFYEDLNYFPKLLYKVDDQVWCELIQKLPRKVSHIFISSEANLHHAYNNLLYQLIEEMNASESMDISSTTSYKLVRNLVEFELKKQNIEFKTFEFKLCVENLSKGSQLEDLLISSIHGENQ